MWQKSPCTTIRVLVLKCSLTPSSGKIVKRGSLACWASPLSFSFSLNCRRGSTKIMIWQGTKWVCQWKRGLPHQKIISCISKSWVVCVCVAHSSHPIYLVALCIMHEGNGTDGSSRPQCWHLIAYTFQMKQVEGKCQIFLRGNSEQNTDSTAKTNAAVFNSLIIRCFLFFHHTIYFPFSGIVFVLPRFSHAFTRTLFGPLKSRRVTNKQTPKCSDVDPNCSGWSQHKFSTKAIENKFFIFF